MFLNVFLVVTITKVSIHKVCMEIAYVSIVSKVDVGISIPCWSEISTSSCTHEKVYKS